ncbi:hypothetical protein YC2023_048104 [Brassica napus]
MNEVRCCGAFSPTSSLLVKSASYGLDLSTKLLKVLNRIWSLAEQNAANISLNMELDKCRTEIKEVIRRVIGVYGRRRRRAKGCVSKELDDERKVGSKTLFNKTFERSYNDPMILELIRSVSLISIQILLLQKKSELKRELKKTVLTRN